MRPTSLAPWSLAAGKLIGILCLGLVSAVWTSLDREWNFDCVGYAAAARALLGESGDALHANVYADLARAAPSKARRDIAEGSAYRKTLSRDSEAFLSQVPLYRNKPLYLSLLALLTAAGANGIDGGFWISSMAFGALASLLVHVLSSVTSAPRSWLITIALIALPPIREAGRIATPDALCALFGFAAARCIILGSSEKAAALLLLAVLARPDMVLFVFAVLAWLAKSQPARRHRSVVWAAISALAAGSAMTLGYPWRAVFVHTFVKRLTSPDDFALAHVTVGEYFGSLLRGLRGDFVLHPSVCWLFLLVSALGGARARDRERLSFALAHVLVWASFAAHVALFPMVADRFFLSHYLSIALLGAIALTRTTKLAPA